MNKFSDSRSDRQNPTDSVSTPFPRTLVGSILITNDDGAKSPLLQPFIEALDQCRKECVEPGKLQIAVPEEERSWIGQAASLRDPVTLTAFQSGPASGYLFSGTPADCVSIAIQNISETPPSLCVSGINIGTNVGMAFYSNSGTLGAARQSVLCGVPAIAISAYLPQEVFSVWRSGDVTRLAELSTDWSRIAAQGVAAVVALLQHQHLLAADLYSINLPWQTEISRRYRITRLARLGYNQLFQKNPAGYYQLQPSFEVLRHEVLPTDLDFASLPSDIAALRAGEISITPIFLDGQAVNLNRARQLQEALD